MSGLPWRAHQWCLDRFRETEENGQLVTTGVTLIGPRERFEDPVVGQPDVP